MDALKRPARVLRIDTPHAQYSVRAEDILVILPHKGEDGTKTRVMSYRGQLYDTKTTVATLLKRLSE